MTLRISASRLWAQRRYINVKRGCAFEPRADRRLTPPCLRQSGARWLWATRCNPSAVIRIFPTRVSLPANQSAIINPRYRGVDQSPDERRSRQIAQRPAQQVSSKTAVGRVINRVAGDRDDHRENARRSSDYL